MGLVDARGVLEERGDLGVREYQHETRVDMWEELCLLALLIVTVLKVDVYFFDNFSKNTQSGSFHL